MALGLTATLAGLDKFFNILADWPGYIIAANLVLARRFDIAVRDVVMSLAAFTLTRALEVRQEVEAARSSVLPRAAIASAAILAAVLAAPRSASAAPLEISQQHTAQSSPAFTLRENMRKLWTDHVVWTRGYIVAAVAGAPDAQAAASRLMKNQEDIGAAVATVYGADAGAKLTTLLKEHISIAVDLIQFGKAGDTNAQKDADARWHRNGEAIADFLSKANPHWPRATLVEMMNMHLATTTDEVAARLTRNWTRTSVRSIACTRTSWPCRTRSPTASSPSSPRNSEA
jgi:hypothetical protein